MGGCGGFGLVVLFDELSGCSGWSLSSACKSTFESVVARSEGSMIVTAPLGRLDSSDSDSIFRECCMLSSRFAAW